MQLKYLLEPDYDRGFIIRLRGMSVNFRGVFLFYIFTYNAYGAGVDTRFFITPEKG